MTQFLQIIASLALVVGLIYLAARFIQQLQNAHPQSEGHMRIVSSISVGTREKVVHIVSQDQHILLGISPGQVRYLTTLPPPASPEEPLPKQPVPANISASHHAMSWLKKHWKKS